MNTFDDLPRPSEQAMQRSAALSKVIQKTIQQQGGFIPFSTFMTLALYHPEFGYYMADTMTVGRLGDFTTAPEISPLFGYCLARQCAMILPTLPSAHLLEIGAGTGRLASDVLTMLKRMQCLPDQYYILEISPSLRHQQQALLQTEHPDFFARITWLSTLPEQFNGVIIANEVLDALPFDCFHLNKGIFERGVIWDAGQLRWQLVATGDTAFKNQVHTLRQAYNLPDGYSSELHTELAHFLPSVIRALNQGVILFADYGYGEAEYYHPERQQGTLTCFYHHHRHNNPLVLPGLQDMTAHVNFTAVASIAVDHGCTLLGYTTQTGFLLACGLIEAATKLEAALSPVEQVNMHQAVKLLTLPTEQGERIKFMALGKNVDLNLLGFSLQDRRRDL